MNSHHAYRDVPGGTLPGYPTRVPGYTGTRYKASQERVYPGYSGVYTGTGRKKSKEAGGVQSPHRVDFYPGPPGYPGLYPGTRVPGYPGTPTSEELPFWAPPEPGYPYPGTRVTLSGGVQYGKLIHSPPMQ
eukprot:1471118-Rhodomonas_salina.1